MFHTVPREIGYIRTNDSPLQADIYTTVNYDLSRYLASDMDSRQVSIGMPGPMTSNSSGSSETSYNLPDALAQSRQASGLMQPLSTQLDMPPWQFGSDASAFEHSAEIADVQSLRKRYSSEALNLRNGNVTSAMATKPSFEHTLKVSVILGRALAVQYDIRHDDDSTSK